MDGLILGVADQLFTLTDIKEAGMGLISFSVLIWIVYVWYKKIEPRMVKIETDAASMSAQNQEVVRNNTEALRGQEQANNNVAHALELVGKAIESNHVALNNTCLLLERHDKRAEEMSIVMYQIKAGVDVFSRKTG